MLKLKLAVRHARSRKDKRQVINSLKDRLQNRFNVSVAEVDDQDMLQMASMGIVQVSGDSRYVRSSLDSVVDVVREFRPAQLTDYSIELFHQ